VPEEEDEGRAITLAFETCFLITTPSPRLRRDKPLHYRARFRIRSLPASANASLWKTGCVVLPSVYLVCGIALALRLRLGRSALKKPNRWLFVWLRQTVSHPMSGVLKTVPLSASFPGSISARRLRYRTPGLLQCPSGTYARSDKPGPALALRAFLRSKSQIVGFSFGRAKPLLTPRVQPPRACGYVTRKTEAPVMSHFKTSREVFPLDKTRGLSGRFGGVG
jgi:hypothetical protein